MTRRVADAAAEGKQSFHSMVKSIEKDAIDLAVKLAEQKIMAGIGTGGAKAPWDKSPGAGGVLSGTPALGAPGPSMAKSAESTVAGVLGLGSLFGGSKGGDGSGKQVKLIIQNQSSTPVAATSGTASFDAEGFVITTVLKDLNQGGSLAKAFGIG